MNENEVRNKFLEEVRMALTGGKIAPVKSHSRLRESAPPPSAEGRKALVEKFVQEALAVGGLVHRATDAEEVKKHLLGIAEKYEAKLAVRWNDPLLEELGVDDTLVGAGVEVVTANLRVLSGASEGAEPEGESVEEARAYIKNRLSEGDLGISGARYAIADTGTLVLAAGEGSGRSVTALPPVHVAVLEADRLVSSMEDLLALLNRSEEGAVPALESCLSFITGPSRTGDIELALTIGVHGPRELHVILLDPVRDR